MVSIGGLWYCLSSPIFIIFYGARWDIYYLAAFAAPRNLFVFNVDLNNYFDLLVGSCDPYFGFVLYTPPKAIYVVPNGILSRSPVSNRRLDGWDIYYC